LKTDFACPRVSARAHDLWVRSAVKWVRRPRVHDPRVTSMATGHGGDSSSDATDGSAECSSTDANDGRVSSRGRRTAAGGAVGGGGVGDVRAGSRKGQGQGVSGENFGEGDARSQVGSRKGAWPLSPFLALAISVAMAMGQLSSQGGMAALCQARNGTWIASALCASVPGVDATDGSAVRAEQVLSEEPARSEPNQEEQRESAEPDRETCRSVPGARPACFSCRPGSYLRLTDSCITQLKAQGPSRTCNQRKEEEEEEAAVLVDTLNGLVHRGTLGFLVSRCALLPANPRRVRVQCLKMAVKPHPRWSNGLPTTPTSPRRHIFRSSLLLSTFSTLNQV